MKTNPLLMLALLATISLAIPATAQKTTDASKSKMSTSKMATTKKKVAKKKPMPKHPKNEITKLEKDRKTNNTVKQVTPDPKKSPGKHADNLSKNVNNEINRESKDFNNAISGKKKKP